MRRVLDFGETRRAALLAVEEKRKELFLNPSGLIDII
jgi:hypothetical protein